MRIVDKFKKDVYQLASVHNIDHLPGAIHAVVQEVKAQPSLLDEQLIEAIEFTIKNQVRFALVSRFNIEGLSVVKSAIFEADQLKEMLPEGPNKESWKWRWGGFFDLINDQIDEVKNMQEMDKASVGRLPEILNDIISLQQWFRTDDKGELQVVKEAVDIY